MARTPDAQLKDRILDVAQGLLKGKGEKGLTLRAVADAAGTTTPTVYKRFPDKAAILEALAIRERDRFIGRLFRKKSLRSVAFGYLEWAIEHPHEYQLIYSLWDKVFTPEHRPGLRWTEEQLADLHGGSPEEYTTVVHGLWLALHGAASMVCQTPTGPVAEEIRRQCLASCDQILERAAEFRVRAKS